MAPTGTKAASMVCFCRLQRTGSEKGLKRPPWSSPCGPGGPKAPARNLHTQAGHMAPARIKGDWGVLSHCSRPERGGQRHGEHQWPLPQTTSARPGPGCCEGCL